MLKSYRILPNSTDVLAHHTGIAFMSLPQGNKKEEMQRAYFRAVVAKAGASFYVPNYDCGADFVLTTPYINPRGKTAPTTRMVFCQLKASDDCEVKEGKVVYELKAESYNKFAELHNVLAIILLLHLPKNEEDWLLVDQSAMCIKHCCYWYEVPKVTTDNTCTITIKIPTHQVFDPNAVDWLLEKSPQNIDRNGR